MTTTASPEAVRAELKAELEGQLREIDAATATAKASSAAGFARFVLVSEYGGLVSQHGDQLRLWGLKPDASNAAKFKYMADAMAQRDRWNAALTDEQRNARCAVDVMALVAALGVMRGHVLKLLANIAA